MTHRTDPELLLKYTKAFLLTVGVLSSMQFFASEEASAQSRQCRQLEANLAALGSQRGSTSEYRKYDRAVRDQTVQINRTRRLAQRNRCNLGLFSKRGGQCERINATLDQMRGNLSQLKRQRSQASPGRSGSSHERKRIERQLRRLRCGDARSATENAPRKDRRRTLLEQIFGVRTYGERGSTVDEAPVAKKSFGGTFRTLCVRESDGYYFPISFSTRRDFFERDEQTCQAMCPSEKVGLFHHRMPGEDSEQMVEYGTEQPYATKPFAFAYRKEVSAERSCRFAKAEFAPNAANVAGDYNDNSPAFVQRVGVPIFRVDPHISPDDYHNRIANFDRKSTVDYLRKARNPDAPGLIASPEAKQNVRIVGPAFFPVQ